MKPERQQDAFHATQRRAAGDQSLSTFAGQDLATIGESLCCYVPRLLRHLDFEQLLVMPYAEIESLYGTDSWAIDDLICLLGRIADDAGADAAATEFSPGMSHGESHVESETARWVSSSRRAEIEPAASADSPVPPRREEPTDETGVTSSEHEAASCAFDDVMHAEFESMREVLITHTAHPSLDEELREFLEPEDTEIPTEFIGNSVREVLETPFVRLARRWVDRGRVRCLLNLLARAAESVRSLTGCPDEDATSADVSLRSRTISVAREINDDGESWRAWCDIIHGQGIQWMKLGTVAECLRDLPSTLWHRPLADFTALTFRQLCEMPAIGPKRLTVSRWLIVRAE